MMVWYDVEVTVAVTVEVTTAGAAVVVAAGAAVVVAAGAAGRAYLDRYKLEMYKV